MGLEYGGTWDRQDASVWAAYGGSGPIHPDSDWQAHDS